MPYKVPDKSGIYLIESSANRKRYVGSAMNLRKRKNAHLHYLKNGYHDNDHLQRHYNKHGDVLQFSILEYCDKEKLIEREQYYIDTLTPEFNICKMAGSHLGVKRSEETKKKISDANKGEKNYFYGKKRSDKYKKKMSEVTMGHPVSDETRKKISDAKKNVKASEEHKRKNSESQKGKRLSEEHKRKISEAMQMRDLGGEKHHLYGKPMRDEIKLKISETNKGRKMSDEFKEKVRVGWIKRKAKYDL